jgi:hypothetical protein
MERFAETVIQPGAVATAGAKGRAGRPLDQTSPAASYSVAEPG